MQNPLDPGYVNRDIPAWEIHCGTPARKLGERSRRLLALEKLVAPPEALAV